MEEDFLVSIGRRPEDLTLRLVYADWLNERGEDEKAEMLRLTVERKRSADSWFWSRNNRLYFLRANLDKRWQRRAIEPPIPLAARADRAWLAALFGGDAERAALGGDGPPSLLDDCTVDAELLWGWPSLALLRFALLASRHVVDRCASTRATQNGPWETVRANLDRVEEAWQRGGFDYEAREEIELATYAGLETRKKSHRDAAINAATSLAYDLRAVLATPYQSLWNTRPAMAFSVIEGCVQALVALAWSPFGLERAHAAKRNAEAQAKAAAARAEKTERELASLPDREEASGRDPSALGLELTLRRDHARDVAKNAQLVAERTAARCPPAPNADVESRGLFRAVGPTMVEWIRTDPDLAPDRLITSEERSIVERNGATLKVRFGPDGRMERVY